MSDITRLRLSHSVIVENTGRTTEDGRTDVVTNAYLAVKVGKQ